LGNRVRQEVEPVSGWRGKKGGRVTRRTSARSGRLTAAERASLEDIFEKVLRSAPRELTEDLPPVAVEIWASSLWAMCSTGELIDMDAVKVFAGGLIKYAGERRTPSALMVLRALGAVAPEPYGSRARREADRIAAAGVADRSWASLLGTEKPTVAWLVSDPIDDDGVSVMVGFDGPGGQSTVGVYIDHNLGGIAKDVFVVPAGMDEVLAGLRQHRGAAPEPEYGPVSLEEAAVRWAEAFELTDMTLDPPTSEDLDELGPLVHARLAKLPAGGVAPWPAPLTDEERDRVLDEFLDSDEAAALLNIDEEDGTVEHLAQQILTFSQDYVRGTSLRFSPAMVEIFCLAWAPRKIALDRDGFILLPEVLATWIRFAGTRRGIPEESIVAALDEAHNCSREMIDLSQDPEAWGPAKTMALAIQELGIDLDDPDALDDFVDEVNRNGGVDVLADSLAQSMRPRRGTAGTITLPRAPGSRR
jgi:hypothetical protein